MPQIGDIKKGKDIGYTSNLYNKFIWSACSDCGKERWVHLSSGKAIHHNCKSCAVKNNFPHGKGGKPINHNGYIDVLVEDSSLYTKMRNSKGYVSEHRLVMAQYLGRCLEPWEVVHHINGIKSDNNINNLEIASKSEHLTYTFMQQRIKLLEERILLLEAELVLIKSNNITSEKK